MTSSKELTVVETPKSVGKPFRLPSPTIPAFILTGDQTFEDIPLDEIVNKDTNDFWALCLNRFGWFDYKGKLNEKGHLLTYFFTPSKLATLDGIGLSCCDLSKRESGYLGWIASKLTYEQFRDVVKFFKEIYEENKSECAVVLFYNHIKDDWKVLYPIQTGLSGGSVTYHYDDVNKAKDYEAIPEYKAALDAVVAEYTELLQNNYRPFGTIHSHCNFAAFHSSTDDRDEKDFSGLHITVGNILSGLDFAQRINASGIFVKIPNIGKVVDFPDVDVKDKDKLYTQIKNLIDDVDKAPSVLEKYKDRLYIKPAPTKTEIVKSSAYDYGKYNSNRHWDNRTQSWGKNPELKVGKKVWVNAHYIKGEGVITQLFTLPKGLESGYSTNYVTNRAYVKMIGFKKLPPILFADFDLQDINEHKMVESKPQQKLVPLQNTDNKDNSDEIWIFVQ